MDEKDLAQIFVSSGESAIKKIVDNGLHRTDITELPLGESHICKSRRQWISDLLTTEGYATEILSRPFYNEDGLVRFKYFIQIRRKA